MAKLRFFDNMFEDEFQEVEFNKTKTLKEQIADFSFENSYNDYMVECYDPETGETFYASLDEETGESSILITVNGVQISDSYKPEDNDIINIIFLPLAWDWGRFAAISAGAVLGGGLLFLAGFLTGGLSWALAIPTLLGAVEGGIIGWLIHDSVESLSSNSSTTNYGKSGENLPDVRGSENQELTGNNFPFVIGKHLVTPFILGQPYTEYSGENGKDAYIRECLLVGYGPLCLTDLKLGDYWLAYNRDSSGTSRDTLLRGKLKGYSQSGAKTDSGDILDLWKNNDVEVEIIQQHPDKDVWYGDIYPNKIVDKDVNANSLYVCDKSLDDVINVTYKGTSYPNTFRTNTVQFSESCPKKVTVTLDFPQGLYATYTKTSDSSSDVKYESIPLWFALQWRAYNSSQTSSKSNGSDYIDDSGSIYSWHGNWSLDSNFKGTYEKYTAEKVALDYKAHKGNTFDTTPETQLTENLTPIDTSEYASKLTTMKGVSNTGRLVTYESFGTQYRFWGRNNIWFVDLGHKGKIYCIGKMMLDSTEVYFAIFKHLGKRIMVISTERGSASFETGKTYYTPEACSYRIKGTYSDHVTYNIKSDITFSYKAITNMGDSNPTYEDTASSTTQYVDEVWADFIINEALITSEEVTNLACGGWVDKKLFNFQGYSGEDGLSEMRCSFTKEFTKEECLQFSNDTNNSITGIEVRLVRVSPNYLNQTSGTSEVSAYQYQDSVVWKSIVTEVYDEDKLLDEDTLTGVPVLSESDMRKFCLVSIKAKADSTGLVQQSFKKFNCIAQSFSPIWKLSSSIAKWLPEGITKQETYYGYSKNNVDCDKGQDTVERVVTKAEYEAARLSGLNWIKAKEGSNYQSVMTKQVMANWSTHNNTDCVILNENGTPFLETNSASGFVLACVGGQNGAAALGYEDLNLLSIADSFDFNKDVVDGSTYKADTVFDGITYSKGDEAHVKFEANGYIYQGEKLEDLLKEIAITCRAVWTFDEEGHIKLITDKPQDFVQGVINQQNTISGTNTYSYAELPAGLMFSFPDENDGYQNNNIYCFDDGYSLANYHGQIENYSIKLVTNPGQIWSLGRYVLACRLLQRESLTRKIGAEGHTYSLNDIILVQSDELLIGEGSGRVKEVIKENGKIYGVVTDTPYLYKNNGNLGVSIVQTKFNGASKSLTYKLPTSNYTFTTHTLLSQSSQPSDWNTNITDYGYYNNGFIRFTATATPVYTAGKYYAFKDYILKEGMTNVVLFTDPVTAYTGDDTSYTVEAKVDIKLNDIVLYGEINTISQKYKIVKIKQDKDGTFTESLLPYYDSIYKYGAPLPSFQSTLRLPSSSGMDIVISETQSVSDRAISNTNIYQYVNDSSNSVSEAVMAEIEKLYSNHTVTLYRAADDDKTKLEETGITAILTYDFSKNTIAWSSEGTNNGWSLDYPKSATTQVYVTSATAFGKGTTANIQPSSWATPLTVGNNGSNGLSTAVVTLYRRATVQPSKPEYGGTYTFNTGKFVFSKSYTVWSQTPPGENEQKDPLWSTIATALTSTAKNEEGLIIDTIEQSEWSDPIQIAASETITEEQVREITKEQLKESSNYLIYCVTPTVGFAVSSDGTIPVNQIAKLEIHVLQYGEDLDYLIDEDKLKDVFGDQFSYTYSGKIITLTALKNKKINEILTFKIPINFKKLIQSYDYYLTPASGTSVENSDYYANKGYELVESIPENWADEYNTYYLADNDGNVSINTSSTFVEGKIYKQVIYNTYGRNIYENVFTQQYCYITCEPKIGGSYYNGVESLSKLNQLMTDHTMIINDYIVWTGDDVASDLSATGGFEKSTAYRYNGNTWEVDTDRNHIANTVSDVVSCEMTDLEYATRNPDAFNYFNTLFASKVVAKKIVVQDVFAEALNAAKITLKDDGSIQGNYTEGKTGFYLDSTGKAELNQVVVRGKIFASSLYIGDNWEFKKDDWDVLNNDFSSLTSKVNGTIKEQKAIYWCSSSGTIPEPPSSSSEVSGSTGVYEQWSYEKSEVTTAHPFLFACIEYTYADDTKGYDSNVTTDIDTLEFGVNTTIIQQTEVYYKTNSTTTPEDDPTKYTDTSDNFKWSSKHLLPDDNYPIVFTCTVYLLKNGTDYASDITYTSETVSHKAETSSSSLDIKINGVATDVDDVSKSVNTVTDSVNGIIEYQTVYCWASTTPSAPTDWITSTSSSPSINTWTTAVLSYNSSYSTYQTIQKRAYDSTTKSRVVTTYAVTQYVYKDTVTNLISGDIARQQMIYNLRNVSETSGVSVPSGVTTWIERKDVEVGVWTKTKPTASLTQVIFSCTQFQTYAQRNNGEGTTCSCTTPTLTGDTIFDPTSGFLRINLIKTSQIVIGSLDGFDTFSKGIDTNIDNAKDDVYSAIGVKDLTNKTIIKDGKIWTDIIDAIALFAQQITLGKENSAAILMSRDFPSAALNSSVGYMETYDTGSGFAIIAPTREGNDSIISRRFYTSRITGRRYPNYTDELKYLDLDADIIRFNGRIGNQAQTIAIKVKSASDFYTYINSNFEAHSYINMYACGRIYYGSSSLVPFIINMGKNNSTGVITINGFTNEGYEFSIVSNSSTCSITHESHSGGSLSTTTTSVLIF